MPTVTYDRRSFMLDGRRIWIASASMHFARVPRAPASFAHARASAARPRSLRRP